MASRNQMQRDLAQMNRSATRLRDGKVVTVSPLTITVGGATPVVDAQYSGAQALVVGDVVKVLVGSSTMLVIGRAGTTGTGITGPTGPMGPVGPVYWVCAGTAAGNADPGAQAFTSDSATNPTKFALDDLSGGSVDVSAWMNSFDDSTDTHKGYLEITHVQPGGGLDWMVFRVDSLSDNSGWTQVNVTRLATSGYSISGFDNVFFAFSRTGNAGTAGAAGTGVGAKYTWSTAGGSPATGVATSSSGALRLNETDANSITLDTQMDTWDDGTSPSKGVIVVEQLDGKVTFYEFSAIVDNGTWREFTSLGSGGASIANGATVYVSFHRTGNLGATGSAGSAGAGGPGWVYSTTTTDADPGSGTFRASNTDLSVATTLYMDLLSTDGSTDMTTWLDALDDSTSSQKGYMILKERGVPANFVLYSLTGWTTATGYRKLTVAAVAWSSTTPFANADTVDFLWTRTGDQGVSTGIVTGAVIPYAAATAPAGYGLCDGSAKARTGTDGDGKSYAALFTLIGTTFGVGNGSTTFNLPDLQGRSVYGKGTHTTIDTLGENDGEATVANRTPVHKHTIPDLNTGETPNKTRSLAYTAGGSAATIVGDAFSNASHSHLASGWYTNLGGAHYMALNYIIKL